MSGAQSHHFYGPNDTLDSNGNEIRGRKIDSPHLLVVKEMQEIEEEDYGHHDKILN